MADSNVNRTIKERVEDLVQSVNPRKISQELKKQQDLFDVVNREFGNTLSEKIYNYLNPNQQICELGNIKKFQTLQKGYGFCGSTSRCQCAKQSVSVKVSRIKKSYSSETKQEINNKRKSTVQQLYGVSNVGQTQKAKQNHKKFYSEDQNRKAAVSKVKQTKKERYGDSNWNNPEKIKQTLRKTFNSDYFVTRYQNENYKILLDKHSLAEHYEKYSPQQLADKLEVHVQTVYRHLNLHGIKTPYESSEEREIADYLHSIGVENIVRNTRKLLPSGKEIDIYLPDYNLAIEYNGVYWHHEDVAHITRSYHYNKYKQCQEQGITLITVFSNFWKSKPDIVKNILSNKLGLNCDSIPARKCSVRQIQSRETKQLLDENHIQGYTPASICLGLFYQDNLVAVMTFSKSRIALGKTKERYALVRFCSKHDVVCGASKLLSYFRKHVSQEKIYSYSNNEWSNGDLYRTLGFKLLREVAPSYWYLKPREEVLLHRFNFSKQKLVKLGYDSRLTEKQITQSMGLMKVWDCGKRVWILE